MSLASIFRSLAMAAALCACGASAQAPGDVRIALVIGNSSYTSAPALANPANDARAMGEALRALGFKVIEVRDGSKAQMADAVEQVKAGLKGQQGIGMLYYAGHGLQVDARNYMVPVDAKMAKAADVLTQTVEVGSVISAFKSAGNRMNILVLDACRDNPFGGITTGKGLAPLDAPSGTFLAYATAPGNVAEDGDARSGNGLYTQYLLQELKKPQASIENVFKRVRFAVRKASNGRQIPWESTSLEDDFQFNDGRIVAVARPTSLQVAAAFTAEKAEWDRIKDSVNVDDFYAFVQKYPSGPVSEAASARINLMAAAAIKPQGLDGSQQSYLADKFRLGDEFETSMTVELLAFKSTTRPARSLQKVIRVGVDRIEIQETSSLVPGRAPTLYFRDGAGGMMGTDEGVRFNPPRYDVPGGLMQVGRRFSQAYEFSIDKNSAVTPYTVTQTGHIAARELITTQAGTFNAFRFEVTSRNSNSTSSKPAAEITVWISPDLPVPVRTIIKLPESRIVTDLVRVSRGG
ncbi:hypothetical protein BH11PSE7_BH11PSE7_04790 [soil metagenome]